MGESGRPPRKPIPDRIKLEVFLAQGGRCAATGTRLASIWAAEFDHCPSLGLRPVNDDGTDYRPAQLDPAYIQALHPDAHRAKTSDDQGRIAKVRRIINKRAGTGKPPSRWPKRVFPTRQKRP